jgi:hypothetical protein
VTLVPFVPGRRLGRPRGLVRRPQPDVRPEREVRIPFVDAQACRHAATEQTTAGGARQSDRGHAGDDAERQGDEPNHGAERAACHRADPGARAIAPLLPIVFVPPIAHGSPEGKLGPGPGTNNLERVASGGATAAGDGVSTVVLGSDFMSAAVFPEGPVFPSLGPAAHHPQEPWFVAARRLDEPAAGKIARQEIFGRVLAPADIRQSSATALDRIRLLQVPFWRVEVSIDGFHVGVTSVRVGNGPIGLPLPLMSSKHRSGSLMVSARNAFPYQLKVPSALSRTVRVGIPALEVGAEDVVPEPADGRDSEGEIVDCDVTRDTAERTAQQALLNAVEPSQAIYSKYEPRVQAVTLVRYPIYYLRYRYDGEARLHAAEDCAVAVSARTGKLVSARHPSGARAAVGKLKRLFSFK